MGIKQLILKALGYPLGTRQGSLGMSEMQVPPGWAYDTYLQAYGQIGWLFACVNVIAGAVAKMGWHLYETDSSGEREEITKHPFLDLWNNPNPFQTRYQYLYMATMYKKLVGRSSG